MIKPFYKSEDRHFTLLKGDCIELLKSFDFKFDMIFADPPYHLSNGGISVQSGKMVSVNKGNWDKSRGFEEDYLFDKKYKCPVCDSDFDAKTVRTGKVRMKNVDIDLRPDYDELDQNKYDVIACPHCGYAALGRYFPNLNKYQIDDIRVKICMNYLHEDNKEPIYSYDYAKKLYQLALANAVVKKAKNSEKAYICLKSAWVVRMS